jgi:hypothetical protein
MAKKNKKDILLKEIESLREKMNNLYNELNELDYIENKKHYESYIGRYFKYKTNIIYIKNLHDSKTYFNCIKIRKDTIFSDSAVTLEEIELYTETNQKEFEEAYNKIIDNISIYFSRREGVYEMNDIELNRYKRLIKRLNRTEIDMGAAGGRYSIEFTPTGIGTVVILKDNGMNRQYDITNFESW